ncbi:MAG: hypothetical protein R6X02_05420 [Enhygromyxa sp.]
MSFLVPEVMQPRERWFFTPILWRRIPSLERHEAHEWPPLRERFAAAREGRFEALDDLLEIFLGIRDPATRLFARALLGAAGTERQLERVEAFVLNNTEDFSTSTELCSALGVWGRLSVVEAILFVYDRSFPAQSAEGIPAYLTTMLEPEFGPAADYPREDTIEAFTAYETGVRELWQQRLTELGGPKAYAFYGGPFSVRRLAERYLELLGSSPYEVMMQPYLRRRFEESTGIDCSEFYVNTNFQPLTAAARLEAWLDSSAPEAFEPGERYFFGHRIPREG